MSTATQRYKMNREQIDNEITELQTKLEIFDRAQATEQRDWGYAGTVDDILAKLGDINESFTPQDAAPSQQSLREWAMSD